jgi:capsid assembly protease
MNESSIKTPRIHFHQIASRFFNQPLLLTPSAARTVGLFLANRIDDGFGATPRAADGRPEPYRRTTDGTAIITIVGEMVNRGAWIGASSGLISYEGLKFQLSRAVADPEVNSILVDIESPGGEAVGAFEAAAAVRAAAAQKRVVAIVNGMAASAGYALISGASEIVTTETGMSGSIGVVMMHLDASQMLKNEGLQPTLIFAGDHKVDGNPFEALSEGVKINFQAQVDDFYNQFVATVAAGRRKLTPGAIRATQARIFTGAAAVKAGLADRIGTFESTLADLARAGAGRSKTTPSYISATAEKATPDPNPFVSRDSPLFELAEQRAAAAFVTNRAPEVQMTRDSPIVALAKARAAAAAAQRHADRI